MDLTFSDEHQMLATSARAFVERETSLDLVRKLEASEIGFDLDHWKTMVDLGWTELGPFELAVVCEELGRGLVPSPLIPTTTLDPGAETVATLGLTPHLAPWAASAEKVFVIIGDQLHRVVGATCERRDAIGGEPLYGLSYPDAALAPAGPAARVRDTVTVASIAYIVGAAERALEMTVEYAGQREQFGRPIGTFQAVSHRCVDMRSDIDASRLLAYQAAWAIDRGVPSELPVAAAKAYASDAMRRIFVNAHQVHGAVAFSTEHDLQLFTRRAKAFELSFGSATEHRERVAAAMGLGAR